jgi:hypothetical protein
MELLIKTQVLVVAEEEKLARLEVLDLVAVVALPL